MVQETKIAAGGSGGETGKADWATQIQIYDDETTNNNLYITFTDATAVELPQDLSHNVYGCNDLSFNPSTGTLSATAFSGPLAGNATTASTADTATKVTVTDNESTPEDISHCFCGRCTIIIRFSRFRNGWKFIL